MPDDGKPITEQAYKKEVMRNAASRHGHTLPDVRNEEVGIS